MESKRVKLIEIETRKVVITRGRGWEKWEAVGKRVQTFSYKMSKFWGSNVQHVDYI